MDRQSRQLTILSVVLLAIVAFLMLDWQRADADRPADANAPASHDLFSYTSDQITRLTITRPDGKVQFEKKDSGWTMTEPVSVAAEASKVEAIIDRFETLRVEEADLSGGLADYGLDDAQRTEVRLEKADGTAFTVYVGKDTVAGYKTYAQVPGDAAAHVVDSQLGSVVARSADDFRDRELLSFAAGGARRVRIVQGGTDTVLRRDDTGWWIGDTGPRADGKKVSEYLSAITLMKVEAFLDGKTAADVGLTTPYATITVEDEGGTHTLKLAAPDAEGAAGASSDLPVRVASADVATLLEPHDWASTRLFDAKSWKVEAVSLALGDKKLEADRKDGAWKKPDGTDATGIDDIVSVLLDLPVDRSTAVTMAGTHGRVSIGLGAGQSIVVQIGDELAGGARVAKEEGGGPAFTIPKDTLALLADAIDGKAKPKLPPSPHNDDLGGGGMGGLPPGIDIDELLRQAGQQE